MTLASPSPAGLHGERPLITAVVRRLAVADSAEPTASGHGLLAQYAALMAQARWVTDEAGGTGRLRSGVTALPSPAILLSRWQAMESSDAAVFIAISQPLLPAASQGSETEETVLGALTLVREAEIAGWRFHVENVVTDPRHRRQGIALKLVHHALAAVSEAREPLNERVPLPLGAIADGVSEHDGAALYAILSANKFGPRRLYSTCGFQACGVQVQHRFDGLWPRLASTSPPPTTAPLIRPLQEEDGPSLFSLLTGEGEEMTGWSRPLVPRTEPSLDSVATFSSRLSRFLRCRQVRCGQKRVWVAVAPGGEAVPPVVLGTIALYFETKLTEGHGHPTAHISACYIRRQPNTARDHSQTAQLLTRLQVTALNAAGEQQSWRALLRCSYALRNRFLPVGWQLCSQHMFVPLGCGQPTEAEREDMRARSLGLWVSSAVVTRLCKWI